MEKRKVGLFFGSFNPIHVGHLIIANYMAQYTDLEEVWFVVSPQNPFKDKKSLGNMYDRLEMVNLAIVGADKLRASDIEFNLPQPSYTIDTLTYMVERFPNREFVLIMGEDNLMGLHKWKNVEVLLRDYRILVYPRPGYNSGEWRNHPSVTLTDTPHMELSSTFIRGAIKDKKDMKFLVPDRVLEFIDKKGLYL